MASNTATTTPSASSVPTSTAQQAASRPQTGTQQRRAAQSAAPAPTVADLLGAILKGQGNVTLLDNPSTGEIAVAVTEANGAEYVWTLARLEPSNVHLNDEATAFDRAKAYPALGGSSPRDYRLPNGDRLTYHVRRPIQYDGVGKGKAAIKALFVRGWEAAHPDLAAQRQQRLLSKSGQTTEAEPANTASAAAGLLAAFGIK